MNQFSMKVNLKNKKNCLNLFKSISCFRMELPFGPGNGPSLPEIIIFIATIVWLVIGIRKWFAISKWSKKYERFKQKQAELERKFDEEDKSQGI